MDSFPDEDVLIEDETKRKRDEFIYSNDVLIVNSEEPFSIWPISNAEAIQVINKKINYNDMPYDEQNETEKGLFFEDQRILIGNHNNEIKLCEALQNQPCLMEKCSLFKSPDKDKKEKTCVCREFKLVFKK